MRGRNLSDLFILGGIWGSAFLFMRIGVIEFGPFALMSVRSGVALAVLVPLMLWRQTLPVLLKYWQPIFLIGLTNAAIPFSLMAYAALTLPSGVLAILNASTPLWGAVITWVWLREALPASRIAGLFVGFAGILWLVWDEVRVDILLESVMALSAGLLAPFFYGFSASLTKRHLMGANASAVACGCLLSAAVILAPLAWLTWPEQPVSQGAWSSVLMLALLCTGFAHILFYRLLLNVGPAKASTVALLIPVFAVLWGWMWLDEVVTIQIVGACVIILLGTALANGLLKIPKKVRKRIHKKKGSKWNKRFRKLSLKFLKTVRRLQRSLGR